MTQITLAIIFSILGGILPSLFWLAFWLREDKHPEPVKNILRAFIFGMIAVPITLIVQFVINKILLGESNIIDAFHFNFLVAIISLAAWAGTEEILKYWAARKGGIGTKENNEPIDPMIYLITAALGFSALENILYLFWPILEGNSSIAFIMGNMRFIGATLLHVATAAIIGASISLSYFKNKKIKKHHLMLGFIVSISLHTFFNYFIIKTGQFTFLSFILIWIVIIAIIFIFEKVKKIYLSKINS